MALQQAFGFLQPILYDADFIHNPRANSTALDAAADDHAFSNILSDASRAFFNDATYTLPPSPIPFAPEVSNEEEPTDSGVVLSSLKFYTGRRRGQSCRISLIFSYDLIVWFLLIVLINCNYILILFLP